MITMTEIELELISDNEMHLFIEKRMRVGISYIGKRYSKANNKTRNLMMLMNQANLYGWGKSQCLPYSGFELLNQKQFDKFNVNPISNNSPIEYILEVDLEYPDKLHELHNDYPYALEKLKISQNMLSIYCSNIANKYDIKICGVNKLVRNLGNKSKCVLHYINLQLYLSVEMKLVNVHRILKFKQSDWLKKCIGFNTDKRKNSGNSFEKDFF